MALKKNSNEVSSSVVTLMPARGSREIKSRIQAHNESHIINRLTQLYTKPVDATVREIVSNAVDATNRLPEADRKPIKITSPTVMLQSFIVQDFASGMSLEFIENEFPHYGASDKTDDVNAIGSHGLGGKAPLAYTSYFDGVTTHEGVTTKFTVSRASGDTKIIIHSVENTNAPSGTTITVPLESFDDIALFAKALETYKNHPHRVAMEIDGELVRNDDYLELGKIAIYEDDDETILGSAYLKKDSLVSFLRSVNLNDYHEMDFAYSLHGWKYSAKAEAAVSCSSFIVVELLPAILNFDSSRDSITYDSKLEKINTRVTHALREKKLLYAVFARLRELSHQELSDTLEQAKLFTFLERQMMSEQQGLESSFKITVGVKYGKAEEYIFPITELDSQLGFNILELCSHSQRTTKASTFSFQDNSISHIADYALSSKPDRFDRSYRHSKSSFIKVSDTLSCYTKETHKASTSDLALSTVAKTAFGRDIKVIAITGVDYESFKRLIRRRKFIHDSKQTAICFITPETSIHEDELKLAKAISPDLTLLTLDELNKIVDPLVIKSRKAKVKEDSTLNRERTFSKMETNFKDAPTSSKELSLVNSKPWETTSFSDIFSKPNTVVFDSTSNSILRGALNANEPVTNATIYILKGGLSATEAKELLQYKHRMYFSMTQNRSKALYELTKDRVFDAMYLDAEIQTKSEASLLKSLAFSGYVGLYSLKYERLINVARYISDPTMRRTLIVMSDFPNCKEILDQVAAKNELLKRPFGAELYSNLKTIRKSLVATRQGETLKHELAKHLLFDSNEYAHDELSRLGYSFIAKELNAFASDSNEDEAD